MTTKIVGRNEWDEFNSLMSEKHWIRTERTTYFAYNYTPQTTANTKYSASYNIQT